jgi:hypothetical protein
MAHRKLIREAADLITQAFRRLADADHAEKELDLTFDDEPRRRAELASSLAQATAAINVTLGQAIGKLRDAQAEVMATNRRAFEIGTEAQQPRTPAAPPELVKRQEQEDQAALEQARKFRDRALAKYKRGGSLHRALVKLGEAGATGYASSKTARQLGIKQSLLRTANNLGVIDAYGSHSDQYALNLASELLLEAWIAPSSSSKTAGEAELEAIDAEVIDIKAAAQARDAGRYRDWARELQSSSPVVMDTPAVRSPKEGLAPDLGRLAFPAGARVRYSGKGGGAAFDGTVVGPYAAGDYDEMIVRRPDGKELAVRIGHLSMLPAVAAKPSRRASDAGSKLEAFILEHGLPSFPKRWAVVTKSPIELHAKGGTARHREEVYTAGAKPTRRDGKDWIDRFAWYIGVGQGAESTPSYLRVEKTLPEPERLRAIQEELTSSYSADFFPFVLHRIDHQWDPGSTTAALAQAPTGIETDRRGFWQWERDTPPPVFVGLPTTSRAGAHTTAGQIVKVNKTRTRIEVREGSEVTSWSWRKGAQGYYEKGRSPRSSSRLGLGAGVDYLDPGV